MRGKKNADKIFIRKTERKGHIGDTRKCKESSKMVKKHGVR
jgi:hypothetical protein